MYAGVGYPSFIFAAMTIFPQDRNPIRRELTNLTELPALVRERNFRRALQVAKQGAKTIVVPFGGTALLTGALSWAAVAAVKYFDATPLRGALISGVGYPTIVMAAMILLPCQNPIKNRVIRFVTLAKERIKEKLYELKNSIRGYFGW